MFKNKLVRHSSTFIMITLASILLIPASSAFSFLAIWVLLAVIITANIINLLFT